MCKIWMIVLLGSILSFSACKDDDKDATQMDRTTFAMQAASSNKLEIMAGQMATEKGQNNDVKEYGEHMVNDHTAATAQLMALVQSKDINISANLTEKHQQDLNTLNPLTGVAFDKAFAALMVKSHQETIDLFDRASTGVNDADFRSFAKAKLPTLRTHLAEAVQLNSDVNK